MEANTRQLHLTFEKGLSNVPSDVVCDDNTLEVAEGMIYKDGEHQVVQKPVPTFFHKDWGETKEHILYVHNIDGTPYLIFYKAGRLLYNTQDGISHEIGGVGSLPITVTSLGKFLIVLTDSSILYFKFNGTGYEREDTQQYLTTPDVRVYCTCTEGGIGNSEGVSSETNADGIVDFYNGILDQEAYNNAVVGLYNSNMNKVAQNRMFCEPFFLRLAVKLIDGTYTRLTAPMLVLPFCPRNSFFFVQDGKIISFTTQARLRLELINWRDYQELPDLVSSIAVFVSKPLKLYKLSGNQPYSRGGYKDIGGFYYDDYYPDGSPNESYHYRYNNNWEYVSKPGGNYSERFLRENLCTMLASKDITEQEVIDATSNMYKIAEINTYFNQSYYDISSYLSEMTLQNLETLERLETVYHYASNFNAKDLFVYNNRLNLISPFTQLFNGYSKFSNAGKVEQRTVKIVVELRINDKSSYVYKEIENCDEFLHAGWFFYPDNRAKHFWVLRDGNVIFHEILKEHSSLEGSYWFYRPMARRYISEMSVIQITPPSGGMTTEDFAGQLFLSEVNNPLSFPAQLHIHTHTDNIIAVASQTRPVSQGQFGEYPLFIFTDEGIFAANIDSEGEYMNIAPISRDVCLRKDTVTPIDDGVVFVTEQGLMKISGNEVTLLSGQLSDNVLNDQTPYLDLIRTANGIAYDYKERLLWICNKDQAVIYNMLNGAFSSFFLGNIIGVSNSSPVRQFEGIYSLANWTADVVKAHFPYTEQELQTDHKHIESDKIVYIDHDPEVESQYGTIARHIVVADDEGYSGGTITTGVYYELEFDGFEDYASWNRYVGARPNENTLFVDITTNKKYGCMYDIRDRLVEINSESGIVNAYPDNILSLGGISFSMLERPTRNSDTSRYPAHLKSRPMKFGDGMAVKSLRQVRHIKDMKGTLGFRLWVSNDLRRWQELHSLHGMPWKYFKFEYLFNNLKATDRFAGTAVVVQDRRTNKLR